MIILIISSFKDSEMDSELMAKLRKRRQMAGEKQIQIVHEPENVQPTIVKEEPHDVSDQYLKNRKKIQDMLANQMGVTVEREPEPPKKEKIEKKVGNNEKFNNARAMLEKQMSKNTAPSSIPVITDSLPPPVVGPSNINSPSLDLPLPPPPPPPSTLPINSPINLPPPPPPPSLDSLPLKISLPPPPIDLPPLKSENQPPLIKQLPKVTSQKQVKEQIEIKEKEKLSKEEQILEKQIEVEPKVIEDKVEEMEVEEKFIEEQQTDKNKEENTTELETKSEQAIKLKQEKQQKVPQKVQIRVSKKGTLILPASQPLPPGLSTTQEQSLFTISKGKRQSKVQQISNQKAPVDQNHRSRKQIAIKPSAIPKHNLSKQLLNKDIASLIKRTFIRKAEIIDNIGYAVEKKQYNFFFPSIETKTRDIQLNQTIYTNTKQLDLVSCFMQKNLQGIKQHDEAKDQFIKKIEADFNNEDPLKMKVIYELISGVTECDNYLQPNFVQIKNTLNRCDNLVKIFSKSQRFKECIEIKEHKAALYDMTVKYMRQPQTQLFHQIDEQIRFIKGVKL